MGAFLDKPKTEKTNQIGEGAGIRYAVSTMQGWRVDMEDSHICQVGLGPGQLEDWAFFGVFDGHAGAKVAHYCSENLLDTIMGTAEMRQVVQELTADGYCKKTIELSDKQKELIRKGMRAGFLALDDAMKNMTTLCSESERSGTTATCALLTADHCFVANLGDSRAVLSKNQTAVFGTEDHKPYLPKERDRIVNAGGSVMIQRVNGSLAVSRALGDYEYKAVPNLAAIDQLVSPEPDVYCLSRDQEKDEFLLLCCDGVYDVMNNAEICDYVRGRLRVITDLKAVGNELLDTCLSKGSRDNMSAVLVLFPGAPQVSADALEKEKNLKEEVQRRIEAMMETDDRLDVDTVMRSLGTTEIPDVPPGGGLHALRKTVEDILSRMTADVQNQPTTSTSDNKGQNKCNSAVSNDNEAVSPTNCQEDVSPTRSAAGSTSPASSDSAGTPPPSPSLTQLSDGSGMRQPVTTGCEPQRTTTVLPGATSGGEPHRTVVIVQTVGSAPAVVQFDDEKSINSQVHKRTSDEIQVGGRAKKGSSLVK